MAFCLDKFMFVFASSCIGGSEASYGCNFFKWCIEDGDDEKDATILRQRQTIYILEKEVKKLSNGLDDLDGSGGLDDQDESDGLNDQDKSGGPDDQDGPSGFNDPTRLGGLDVPHG
ncbi:hypothetical protein DEO72_LG3g2098 [Vigna unguiculata]|uniref:Uncharacterized protein n=1 Tax=Vigna unguiculata TaxID=3917 RepID=A0A4D6LG44_VIGUN|nr:hypothetical protein DEO72_LG3g2096 [Vigna unguiculata]QCD87560.1 hypothetical protein DEO72_LG3g2097 [Vigna unguiculata]QCD87561.1 hypothetical protein DEO72_LG3g2098 [Vigna unguiculata]